MDTRFVLHSRHHARGAIRPVAVAIVAIFAALAAAAWVLIIRPHQELMREDAAAAHLSASASTATRAAATAPVDVEGMDVNELISEARTAMGEQRYLAPAGNNAFEFYLRVLEKDPGNKIASDALRETFPFAATAAEQAINSRDFGEAQREIDLLAKADPTNYTLTILRSKLDAQRKTLDQQQQLALDQKKTQQQQAEKAATEKLVADQLAEQQRVAATDKQKAAQAREPAQQATTPATAAAAAGGATAAAQGAAPSGETTPAVLIKAVAPHYPPSALRSRQEGWVVVSFTIDTEGKPEDVKILDSQPRRVFDRAALEAVSRYRFTPAMKNGVAVTATREQRLEFKL
ncbi:MAG: energy transducer TonB [Pseudomonadota bacterium]|nr:energy transducer TonB [Xanthomonadaceae bacterium]MDE2247814.1 energy transducer TonB [Xanthomonadaceae bacterium]MDE3209558.1 energy transducer TonB [Pseudomonadota bacterium]